jgi:hypothetical protein
MQITAVAANNDARDVAYGEIGRFAVERTALIDHFERRQNSALIRSVDFAGFICEPCCNRL